MAVPTIAQLEPVRVTVGVTPQRRPRSGGQGPTRPPSGRITIATTPRGYRHLLAWAESHGEVEDWGIEGTGSYGAGLARFLHGANQAVIEINRPDRKARRKVQHLGFATSQLTALQGTGGHTPS